MIIFSSLSHTINVLIFLTEKLLVGIEKKTTCPKNSPPVKSTSADYTADYVKTSSYVPLKPSVGEDDEASPPSSSSSQAYPRCASSRWAHKSVTDGGDALAENAEKPADYYSGVSDEVGRCNNSGTNGSGATRSCKNTKNCPYKLRTSTQPNDKYRRCSQTKYSAQRYSNPPPVASPAMTYAGVTRSGVNYTDVAAEFAFLHDDADEPFGQDRRASEK